MFKKSVLAAALVSLSFFQFSCLKDSGCDFSACELVAPAAEIQNVQTYLNSNGLTAVQECSGLFVNITNPGTGAQPGACDAVNVKYTGMLTNGTVFDQETINGITIGLDQVIRGWRIGVPLLKTGGTATFYIPPSLGYGNQDLRDGSGNIVIPANSILIFTVELTAVY